MVFYTEYKDYSLQQKKYMEKFMVTVFDLLTQQCSQITVALEKVLIRFYDHLLTEPNSDSSKH